LDLSNKLTIGGAALTRLSKNHVYVIFNVAGFRPGRRFTFVSAKVNKTIDAQFDLIR